MATKDSTIISNLESSPVVLPDSTVLNGRVRYAAHQIDLNTQNLAADDILRLFPIPKGARIWSVKFSSDSDWGATATISIGTAADTTKYTPAFQYQVGTDITLAHQVIEHADSDNCGVALTAEEELVLEVKAADAPDGAGTTALVVVAYTTD